MKKRLLIAFSAMSLFALSSCGETNVENTNLKEGEKEENPVVSSEETNDSKEKTEEIFNISIPELDSSAKEITNEFEKDTYIEKIDSRNKSKNEIHTEVESLDKNYNSVMYTSKEHSIYDYSNNELDYEYYTYAKSIFDFHNARGWHYTKEVFEYYENGKKVTKVNEIETEFVKEGNFYKFKNDLKLERLFFDVEDKTQEGIKVFDEIIYPEVTKTVFGNAKLYTKIDKEKVESKVNLDRILESLTKYLTIEATCTNGTYKGLQVYTNNDYLYCKIDSEADNKFVLAKNPTNNASYKYSKNTNDECEVTSEYYREQQLYKDNQLSNNVSLDGFTEYNSELVSSVFPFFNFQVAAITNGYTYPMIVQEEFYTNYFEVK